MKNFEKIYSAKEKKVSCDTLKQVFDIFCQSDVKLIWRDYFSLNFLKNGKNFTRNVMKMQFHDGDVRCKSRNISVFRLSM